MGERISDCLWLYVRNFVRNLYAQSLIGGFVEYTWEKLVRELGVGSGEWGAGILNQIRGAFFGVTYDRVHIFLYSWERV
jgi:hypothetical protein